MINLKALSVSIAKTSLSFIPILLAPLLLGPTQELLEFFRLQLVQSILMVLGSLGIGSYVFVLSERASHSRNEAIQLLKLKILFGVVGIFIFVAGCILVLFLGTRFSQKENILYLLLIPFSYFYILQQIELGGKKYRRALIYFSIPSVIFSIILLCIFVIGVDCFSEVTAFVLLGANLIFIRRYGIKNSLKRLLNKSKRHSIWKTFCGLKRQIFSGVLLASCTPVISLVLIDWLSSLHFTPQVISAYYLYVRAVEAAIGLLVTYFIAGHFHKNISVNFSKLGIKSFGVLVFFLGLFYLIMNLATLLLVGYFDFGMAAIELVTGLIKLLLAILTVSYIIEFPIVTGSKEGIALVLILLVKEIYAPSTIYGFQLLVSASFFIGLALMLIRIKFFSLKKSDVLESN